MGVYKRGGIWWYRFKFNGVPFYRSAKTHNRKEAETLYLKHYNDIRNGVFFDSRISKNILFEKFEGEYLKYAQDHKRTPQRDRDALKHLSKFFTGTHLTRISPADIEKYIHWRKEQIIKVSGKNISNATINKELYCLSSFFRVAILNNVAQINPVSKVRKLKVIEKPIEYLDLDEIERLLDAADGYLRSVIMVALHTGCRRSEILNLKWQYIDFTKEIMQIPIPTKNGEFKPVYMTDGLRDCLKAVPRQLHCDYVFHNTSGNPFYNLRKSFLSALKRAGITKHIRFHDLRHTFATHAAMLGIDPFTLMKMLGHKNVRQTQKYIQIADEHRKEAAKKIGKAFDRSKEGIQFADNFKKR